MEILSRIKDVLLGYLQRPSKRRRVTTQTTNVVTTTSVASTQEALFVQVPVSTDVEPKPDKHIATRSAKNKRKREDDELRDDVEGSQSNQLHQVRRASKGSQIDARNEMSSDEKVKMFLSQQDQAGPDVAEELTGRDKWTKDEKLLLQRMGMRSKEPFMPLEWRSDFPTVGIHLFTMREKAFLRGISGDETRACRKFQQLFNNIKLISGQKAISGRPAEMIVSTLIRNYVLFTEKDAGCHGSDLPPHIAIIGATPFQQFDIKLMNHLTEKATKRMNDLAARHRQFHALPLSESSNGEAETPKLYRIHPPVIYGFLIAQRRVAVFSHDTSTNSLPKFLITFQINDPGLAFWNAVGIALVATCARNAMLRIRDELDDLQVSKDDKPMRK